MLKSLIHGEKKSLYIYLVVGVAFILFIGFIIKIYSEPTILLSKVVESVGNKQGLNKSSDGRINVLIIGIDKRLSTDSVESGQLTDTLILASINPEDKSYTLLSFPRDIWINQEFGGVGVGYIGKINGVYATKGVENLIKVIENLTNQKIQYHVAVSFNGFVEAIDTIGGIEVYVENTFDDFAYPIEGRENELCGLQQDEVDKIFELAKQQKICTEDESCLLFDIKNELEDAYDNVIDELRDRYNDKKVDTFEKYVDLNIEKEDDNFTYDDKKYELKVDDLNFPCRYETLHFNQGLQKLDGTIALKYARSRHANGEEGSDFARARRQQLVIDATKNKVLSFSTFSNPVALKNLYDNYKKNVETDISFSEAQGLYSMLYSLENIGSYVISSSDDPTTGGLLDSLYGGEEYDYAFVLIPKNLNYSVISDFVKQVLQKPAAKE